MSTSNATNSSSNAAAAQPTASSSSKRNSGQLTIDSMTADLEQARLDSIDAEVSDPRTLKQKLLSIDVDGEEKPSLATFLQGRVFAEGGESVLVFDGSGDKTKAEQRVIPQEAIMELSDEEYAKILADVPAACKEIAVEATMLFERKEERLAYFMLRQIPAATQDFVEIRVACVGNVDAGKSTTLGVLTRGGLDDGRGKARV